MKEIMNQKELEEYLDVSTNTIRKWRNNGLKIVKIGGMVYYMADTVKEFLKHYEISEYEERMKI